MLGPYLDTYKPDPKSAISDTTRRGISAASLEQSRVLALLSEYDPLIVNKSNETVWSGARSDTGNRRRIEDGFEDRQRRLTRLLRACGNDHWDP